LAAVAPYIVHVGYVLMLGAFLARDVLWLRGLLACAQTLVVIYAFRAGVPSIASWNLLFACINAVWVAAILRERRRVAVPAALQPIFVRHFAALTPQEFLRLWGQGRREVLRRGRLVRDGDFPDALYFLMQGSVRISRNGAFVTELGAGRFVAEMSLLTGEPANADVDAVGDVEAMRWPIDDLRAIRDRNPLLWTRIQSVIGHDIVEKLLRPQPAAASAAP
jgi:hypothetical protein